MQKRIRRSIVFLLVFTLLFANFTSASTAFASETGTAKDEKSAETVEKQESEPAKTDDAVKETKAEPEVTAGDKESAKDAGSRSDKNAEAAGESKDTSGSGKETAEAASSGEGASEGEKEDTGTVKEDAAEPGENADGADNTDDQDAGQEEAAADAPKEDEAQPEEPAEGADHIEEEPAEGADHTGEEPAAEPSEQKEEIAEEDKNQPDTVKKDARKADSAPDIKYRDLTLVVVAKGTTESALDVEYQVKLWKEDGGEIVPFANQTLLSGETTDGSGIVKKSMQLAAGQSNVTATISVPEDYRFKATLSPDATDEVGLFFGSNSKKASEGMEGYTSYLSSVVCNAYVKQKVHIIKEDEDGKPLSGAKLQNLSPSNEVLDSWTSDGSEHTIRLLPNIDNIAGNYYILREEEAPEGYAKAKDIQFCVYPDPTGIVINNTQYKDYTIHMVDEIMPGSLRVEMDFDTQDDLIAGDTYLQPHEVTVEIDGLKIGKPYKVHYTYGPEERDITVYFGPNNKKLKLQLHSYDYLIISGLPAGATYSVSQQTAAGGRYEDPVYDAFKTGTIESGKEAKTVITNTARLFTWTLTKQVPGAYDGQTFAFEFYFVDDFFQWGSAPHYYEINGERFELDNLGPDYPGSSRIRLGVDKIYLKNGDTIKVPNIASYAHYYYNEYPHSSDYVGHTNDSGAIPSDYDVLAINVSKMVGIRKLDQYGNHVAGAKLQILGHDHSTVIEEFTTTNEDYFWSPKSNINDGSNQFYLHEVAAPGGYLISEEDIPFTYEKGEEIEYVCQRTDVWTVKKKYAPYFVTVNGKTVENNIIVMTDTATDVTVSKTDITGEKEIGGASLAVYKAEDVTDGAPKEGAEAIDSWTSEEGKSHQIIGKLEVGGEYVLIETTAPDGYEKASAITFTINSDGTPSTVNMVDEYSTHNIKISKTDVGGKEIAGAEITITGRAKGESKDIGKITYTTDGKAPHEVELKPGTYTMTEVTAPEGYKKAESITFTVEVDGSVYVGGKKVTDSTVTMVDEYSTHVVKISKTDVGGKEIAGAEITITGRADGESEDIEAIKYTTDGKKPHEVELRAGTYTMTEVTAPNGYEKAESITFTVKADGTVLVGGKKVKDSTVTMVDEYSTHVVKISKTDVGGKEIKGAVLTITGREDGASEDIKAIKFTTDGKKPREFSLKPGTYTLTEVTAPSGYEKAESITFTVKADGTVLVGGKDVKGKVTMVDKAKTTKKPTKTTKTTKTKGGRTGDESGVMMYMAIFAAAAAGLAAVLLRKRRRS